MTAEEMDDHLPPPPPAGKPAREKKARAPEAPAPRTSPWADRGLFLAVGLLAGFSAAYLYLDKNPSALPQASLADPHAGLAGVGPGATRDLPGSGGGAAVSGRRPGRPAEALRPRGGRGEGAEERGPPRAAREHGVRRRGLEEGGRRLREGSQAARCRSERPHRSRSRVPEHRQRRQGARDVHAGVGTRSEPLAGAVQSRDRLRHRQRRSEEGARDPRESSRRSIPRSRRSTASRRNSSSERKGAHGRDLVAGRPLRGRAPG